MKTEAIGRPEGTAGERKDQDGPVDLGHLSRYTLGERMLEREILELFCTQAAIYLERLCEAPSDRQWQDAAHSLKGSVQAIGAWGTAAAAERAESLSGATLSEARGARLRELESSVDEAKPISDRCSKASGLAARRHASGEGPGVSFSIAL